MSDFYDGTYMDGFGDDNKPNDKIKEKLNVLDKYNVLGAPLRAMKPFKNYPLSIALSISQNEHLLKK